MGKKRKKFSILSSYVLSSEIPFDFSAAIDPLRAVVFKEACLYRIAEIAESAYQAFAKDNLGFYSAKIEMAQIQ